MEEGENIEVTTSETRRKRQDEKVEINVDYWSLWDEIKNFRSHFNWSDFAVGITLELMPSVWDIGSDFNLAGKWSKDKKLNYFAAGTYFFLSMPGLLMAMKTLYNRVFRRCCICGFTEHWICKFVGYFILMALFGAFFALIGFRFNRAPSTTTWEMFTSAIMTSIFILFTKLMRVFIHGPEMKKLCVKMSTVESTHESAWQIVIISFLIITGRIKLGNSELMTILSSLFMIAKSGAQSLLTFGSTNKLEDKGFWGKWKLILSITPALTMSCLFRTMTLALNLGFQWTGISLLQIAVLLLLKICLPSLSSLTPLDIIQGVASEFSIPSVWGNLGREKSRNIQLGLGIFYLLYNTGVIIVVLWDPSMSVFQILRFHYMVVSGGFLEFNVLMVQKVAITALICGWISFPLHLYQIYWMDTWDKLQVLATV